MTDAAFRPFETMLDRDAALARLRDATAGADDGELFLERRQSESLVFDDGRVRTASFDAAQGFGLRAVRVGRRLVGRVEVLSGLADGQQIVVEGLVRVRDGRPVEVVAVRSGDKQ